MTKEVWEVDWYYLHGGVGEKAYINQRLRDGWEPFAVSKDKLWLRKLVKTEKEGKKHNAP